MINILMALGIAYLITVVLAVISCNYLRKNLDYIVHEVLTSKELSRNYTLAFGKPATVPNLTKDLHELFGEQIFIPIVNLITVMVALIHFFRHI